LLFLASMKTTPSDTNRRSQVDDSNVEALPKLDAALPPVTVLTPPPATDDGGESVLSGQHRDLAGYRPGTPASDESPVVD
jgi:hypothetical protein